MLDVCDNDGIFDAYEKEAGFVELCEIYAINMVNTVEGINGDYHKLYKKHWNMITGIISAQHPELKKAFARKDRGV